MRVLGPVTEERGAVGVNRGCAELRDDPDREGLDGVTRERPELERAPLDRELLDRGLLARDRELLEREPLLDRLLTLGAEGFPLETCPLPFPRF